MGEHGKGFRSEYVADFFGPKLHGQLRRIKASFDPYNQLNPGKLVTPEGSQEKLPRIDEVELRAVRDRKVNKTAQNTFAPALHCNGNGACFTFDTDDVMCPSYKYSKDRLHSPKGRAGVLREWLSQLSEKGYDAGKSVSLVETGPGLKTQQTQNLESFSYDFSHEVYIAMDGCLSCKACTNQCPIKVDIPEMKSRFLEHYHSRYKRPKSDYLISSAEKLHAKFLKVPFLYNLPLSFKATRSIIETLTGMVDPPRLSAPNLYVRAKRRGFASSESLASKKALSKADRDTSVIIVSDAVTGFYEAELVIDIMEAMRLAGYTVYITPFMENGKAKHVKGFLKDFKATASSMDHFLRELSRYKIPMVGIDPAITLTYREEYRSYLGENQGDYNVFLLHEWIDRCAAKRFNSMSKPKIEGETKGQGLVYALLGHCGEKTSSPGFSKAWKKLFESFGLELFEVPVGCCGMAGAFGHEKRHYHDSRGIYELSWKKAIERLEGEHKNIRYIATGASCRSQVKRFDGRLVQHPLQVLLEHIKQ